MWVDPQGNWHIINHAYSNLEYTNCRRSAVSAHFFSADGITWGYSAQPYNHTVVYDDGTEHVYTTLERPNIHFDETGQPRFLIAAADLITGDEGCGSRTAHAHFGHTPCDNCKCVRSRRARPQLRAPLTQSTHPPPPPNAKGGTTWRARQSLPLPDRLLRRSTDPEAGRRTLFHVNCFFFFFYLVWRGCTENSHASSSLGPRRAHTPVFNASGPPSQGSRHRKPLSPGFEGAWPHRTKNRCSARASQLQPAPLLLPAGGDHF